MWVFELLVWRDKEGRFLKAFATTKAILARILGKDLEVGRWERFLQRLRLDTLSATEISAGWEAMSRSSAWQIRNIAVKVAGLGGLQNSIEWLVSIVSSHREKPFLRRNAAVSLQQLGSRQRNVLEALIVGVSDPYWEVRAACLQCLAACQQVEEEVMAALQKTVLPELFGWSNNTRKRPDQRESSFEVRMAWAELAARFPDSDTALALLDLLATDQNWKVRLQVLESWHQLFRSSRLTTAQLHGRMANLDLCAEGFEPDFLLRKRYHEIITHSTPRTPIPGEK